jgi:glycerol-3-phosphate acyltransferase PlsY
MLTSKRRWVIALVVAFYLYFLLPATAELFYELYHLTHIDPIYWGYTGFKAAGYYLSVYEHRLLMCLLAAAAIILIPALFQKLRRA